MTREFACVRACVRACACDREGIGHEGAAKYGLGEDANKRAARTERARTRPVLAKKTLQTY